MHPDRDAAVAKATINFFIFKYIFYYSHKSQIFYFLNIQNIVIRVDGVVLDEIETGFGVFAH